MYKLKVEQEGYNTLFFEFETGAEAIGFVDFSKDKVKKKTTFTITVECDVEESEE